MKPISYDMNYEVLYDDDEKSKKLDPERVVRELKVYYHICKFAWLLEPSLFLIREMKAFNVMQPYVLGYKVIWEIPSNTKAKGVGVVRSGGYAQLRLVYEKLEEEAYMTGVKMFKKHHRYVCFTILPSGRIKIDLLGKSEV